MNKKQLKEVAAVVLAGILTAVLLFAVSGCNSTVTKYDKDGKIAKVTTRNSPLKEKSLSAGGSVSAIKIESTGSATTGTPTANVIIGNATASMSSTPTDEDRPVIGFSWSSGILSSLTNASASSGSITYIGGKGETAEDTAKRVNALLKLKDAAPSSTSTATDSKAE